MKKLLGIVAFLLCLGLSYSASAQAVKKTTHAVEKGAKKAGNETAEVASKGKATVTDKVSKDKVGPKGQKIYIDDHSRYYWIDEKGHRNYVTEAELKPRKK
jgi:hypothetical protein